MGTASSNLDKVGDEVFRFAERHLEIEDIDTLEKVTGIVLSGSDFEELWKMLQEDRKELERRLKEAAKLLEDGHAASNDTNRTCLKSLSNSKQVKHGKDTKHNDLLKRKEELILQLDRIYPGLNSQKVSDELLKLNEEDLSHILSKPTEFENFVKFCSENDGQEDIRTGPTSKKLDSKELLEKFKQEQLEKLSKSELNDEDINTFIGNFLYKRVAEVHPSKAELITGILMEQNKDVVLQLLVSAPVLHKHIASVIDELTTNKKLPFRSELL
eukprot:gene9621-17380_t